MLLGAPFGPGESYYQTNLLTLTGYSAGSRARLARWVIVGPHTGGTVRVLTGVNRGGQAKNNVTRLWVNGENVVSDSWSSATDDVTGTERTSSMTLPANHQRTATVVTVTLETTSDSTTQVTSAERRVLWTPIAHGNAHRSGVSWASTDLYTVSGTAGVWVPFGPLLVIYGPTQAGTFLAQSSVNANSCNKANRTGVAIDGQPAVWDAWGSVTDSSAGTDRSTSISVPALGPGRHTLQAVFKSTCTGTYATASRSITVAPLVAYLPK